MKKLMLVSLYFVLIFFGFVHKSNAVFTSTGSVVFVRDFQGRAPNNFVSESIYRSTFTTAVTSYGSNGTGVQVSTTGSTVLHTIVVSSAGIFSKLELFDARQDTTTNSLVTQFAEIDTTAKGTYVFDLFLSSGFCWYNSGQTPAKVTATYLSNRP